MKRLFFTLTVSFFLVWGCGLGTSEFTDAVLDGASNLNRGKIEKALEDFNRAIKVDPTHQDGYLGRADTLNVMGRYEEALEDYNKAIEIKPTLSRIPQGSMPTLTTAAPWSWIPRLTINRVFLNVCLAMIPIP